MYIWLCFTPPALRTFLNAKSCGFQTPPKPFFGHQDPPSLVFAICPPHCFWFLTSTWLAYLISAECLQLTSSDLDTSLSLGTCQTDMEAHGKIVKERHDPYVSTPCTHRPPQCEILWISVPPKALFFNWSPPVEFLCKSSVSFTSSQCIVLCLCPNWPCPSSLHLLFWHLRSPQKSSWTLCFLPFTCDTCFFLFLSLVPDPQP